MSLQTIIDTAQKIVFDRRKVVGQTISRSQRIKSAKRNTANPLALTVTPSSLFSYASARDMVEGVMINDRYTEFTVKLGNNLKTAYINEYRGSAPIASVKSVTIDVFPQTGTNILIGNLPAITGSFIPQSVLFKAGDWIQPANSRYPYIITQDVLRGNGTQVTATIHRSLIVSENTTVTGAVLIGTDTTLRVVITDLPTYELGMYKFLSWSGDFKLVEKII